MEPGKLYHLYTHANGNENLFRTDENYRFFLKRYAHFISPVADTWVYCLMPNHLHFLIRIKEEKEIIETFTTDQTNSSSNNKTSKVFKNLGGLDGNLARSPDKNLNGGLDAIEKRISQQFSNLFNSYTKAYNKVYARRGSLFIPNFKREEITDDTYLSNIIIYIHNNPVHHGFVKNSVDWQWSSYNAFLTDKPTSLKREEILKWFGNREAFLKFHLKPATLMI